VFYIHFLYSVDEETPEKVVKKNNFWDISFKKVREFQRLSYRPLFSGLLSSQ
jgi:hypothetical protein